MYWHTVEPTMVAENFVICMSEVTGEASVRNVTGRDGVYVAEKMHAARVSVEPKRSQAE